MRVRFFGVRGSVPSPGPTTTRYGGNTSCVHVELRDGTHFILDAGTGIRSLGTTLVGDDRPIHVLLTHDHWDHIQGLPFFQPLFEPDREVRFCEGVKARKPGHLGTLEQFNGHNFPVPLSALPSRPRVIDDQSRFFEGDHFRILPKPLNHPGGGQAYLIEADGARLAYVTDNELDPPYAVSTTYGEWVDYLEGVDLLVHDAQYVEADMPQKHGWGHSLITQVCQLAIDARVGTLALFHHDPDRSDLQLDQIQSNCELRFRHTPTRVLCAYEGLTLELRAGSRLFQQADLPSALLRVD